MLGQYEQLTYINHLGEELHFGRRGLYINASDLHDFSWDVVSVNEKISSFSKSIQTKSIPVRIACPSRADGIKLRNALFEIPERDVLAKQPGRLVSNGYYCECFVTASQKERYNVSEKYMATELTITTDKPFWIKETLLTINKDDDWAFPASKVLDFPFDFPFDVGASVNRAIEANNGSFYESNFRMEIRGLVNNPTIYINDHEYQVNTMVEAGQTLTIDSINKKIYLSDGTNVFNARGRDYYIFQPIPSGDLNIMWDNSFDVDIYLLEERSEPKWGIEIE